MVGVSDVKKIVCILFALLILFSFCSCNGRIPKNPEVDKSGKLTVVTDVNPQLTQDEKSLFLDAQKKYTEKSFDPIAVLGTQVVAGENITYFCKGLNDEQPYYFVEVYKDLEDCATIQKAMPFIVDEFLINHDIDKQMLVGGYTVNTELKATQLPSDVKKGFESFASKTKGTLYTPIALVACQGESNGTDYSVLCTVREKDDKNSARLAVVTFCCDDKGNANVGSNCVFFISSVFSGDINSDKE